MRDAHRLPAESSTSGDTLDALERDHRHVEALFARAALNVGAARLAVIPELVSALTQHAELEEDVVYPAIEAAVGGGDVLAARSREDHAEMKELLDRVAAASVDGAELVADLRRLQFVVAAHVAIEEGEVFPAYRAAASSDDRRALSAALDDSVRELAADRARP